MADDDKTLETHQASAGPAQRPAVQDPFAASAAFPEIPRELTPEELDARQANIGIERKSGPPLPEGEADDASGLALGSGGNAAQRAEETEVKEPPDKS